MLDKLLTHYDPVVRYKSRVHLLEESPVSPENAQRQATIKTSTRVKLLLGEQDATGKIPRGAYHKWAGAHWVLVMLAELDYPAHEQQLVPLREQVYDFLFSDAHQRQIEALRIAGRVRMCAAIEGNAIWALEKLGLADERSAVLVERLLAWQWPDGGWNCDENPAASISSFMETLIPLRGLALYAQAHPIAGLPAVIQAAAEVFLIRGLYRRRHDGKVMDKDFLKLHYPCYWHYDILFGLKVMAEAGFIEDERCAGALDVLEKKRLPNGLFAAEAAYYQTLGDRSETQDYSRVDWGVVHPHKLNPFVSLDALWVLKMAGRVSLQAPLP